MKYSTTALLKLKPPLLLFRPPSAVGAVFYVDKEPLRLCPHPSLTLMHNELLRGDKIVMLNI